MTQLPGGPAENVRRYPRKPPKFVTARKWGNILSNLRVAPHSINYQSVRFEATMQRQSLSTRDARVLDILFDPEAQPTAEINRPCLEKPSMSQVWLTEQQVSSLNSLERHAIKLAEDGSLTAAEELLSQSIQDFPRERPSLWSNRAQVRRLSNNIVGALSDLSQAIRIATPPNYRSPSVDNAKVLASAHVHRATIYMLVARHEITGVLEDQREERLEELASHDFAMGGKYGSQLARAMSVRTNPYAKLCGAMVQRALQAEMWPPVVQCVGRKAG